MTIGVFRRRDKQLRRQVTTSKETASMPLVFSPTYLACFTSTGTGSRKTFKIHFDYLDAAHLTITVNSVAQTNPADWSANGRIITFTTAPGSGLAISICRNTISPRNISDSIRQAMYYAEEIRDATI
jgi:hypothetical protein